MHGSTASSSVDLGIPRLSRATVGSGPTSRVAFHGGYRLADIDACPRRTPGTCPVWHGPSTGRSLGYEQHDSRLPCLPAFAISPLMWDGSSVNLSHVSPVGCGAMALVSKSVSTSGRLPGRNEVTAWLRPGRYLSGDHGARRSLPEREHGTSPPSTMSVPRGRKTHAMTSLEDR
jgi:hypothetical protein